jgi:hypothetical protein
MSVILQLMQDESYIYNYFRRYETTRHKVIQADVTGFREILDSAKDERPVQQYLQAHPQLLCCFLRSGHGEWVIPQLRFGSQYVADFLVGCGNSGGFIWDLIELESPKARLLIKDGQPSKQLRKAVSQIEDWRRWLGRNIDYAQRPPCRGGLGLEDLSPRESATIVIGRRTNVTEKFNDIRRTWKEQSNITVTTYDGLLERFEWILGVVERHPANHLMRQNLIISTSDNTSKFK